MKRLLLLGLALATAIAFGQTYSLGKAAVVDRELPVIGASGLTGAQMVPAKVGAGRPLVLFFFNEMCGVTFYYRSRIARLQRDFAPLGVKFVGIRTGKREFPDRPLTVPESRYLEMPITDDPDGSVGEGFGIEQSVTFAVIDAQGILRYQGGFDDELNEKKVRNPYLRNALRQIVRGQTVSVPRAPAIGCAILRSDRP